MQTRTINKSYAGISIEKWFAENYPLLNYAALQKLIRKKLIKVDGKKPVTGQKLKEGQVVKFPEFDFKTEDEREKLVPPKTLIDSIKNAIIYEDDDIIAINKPWGISTQGGSGVKYSIDMCLPYLKGGKEYRLVHRLDKDTSGVLIIAKTYEQATILTQGFKDKIIKKEYRAILAGKVEGNKAGKIDLPLAKKLGLNERVVVDKDAGKTAITKYKVLKTNKKTTYICFMPLTGRTHQLRVHSLSALFPIVADGKYGGRATFIEHYGKKMLLHSYSIDLTEVLGRKLKVIAPLPDYFRDLLGYYK